MRIDPRIHNNFLDANFWDANGDPSDDQAAIEILDLEHQEEINLVLPFSVKGELEHPNTPPHAKRAASGMIYTERTELTLNEQAIRAKLLALIQGSAKPGKHDRDVLHLFEAQKYGGGYFITKDKRLLKKKMEIRSLLTSLRVVSPSDFMSILRSDGFIRPRSRAAAALEHDANSEDGKQTLRKINYKGYVIRPAPLRLADGRWNHQVYIVRQRGNGLIEKKFFSTTSFATQEEAVTHCIVFGKQIIDGTVPNCSVDDL